MEFFQDKKERYFIIGIVNEEGKRKGYKIYAANQKKVLGIVTKKEATKAKEAGYKIVGLDISTSGIVVKEMLNCYYNLNKLDEVNGKGHPIKSLGSYILISYINFSDDREFRLINSRGYERIVSVEELKVLIDEGKVNGVKRSPRNKDNICIYGLCDYREKEFVETSV